MGKTAKVLGTILKKKGQNTRNSYEKNKNGIREY